MKIPLAIKIAGKVWTVRQDPCLGVERSIFGEMRPVAQEIVIDKLLTNDRKEATLLHEIIEVINGDNELGMEHPQITTLASQLHQVIKDNRLVFHTDDINKRSEQREDGRAR